MTAIDLLYGDAGEAARIMKNFKPAMTVEGYLNFVEEMAK